MCNKINLTGDRFGRLVVLNDDRVERKVLCRCDCGTEKLVATYSLKSGNTISCGCLRRETCRKVGQLKTHGLTGSKLYAMYQGMMSRCYSDSYENPQNYRDKGITVCEEWKSDRQKFFDWAISNGYKDGLSIDRIDNSNGYSPDNCRFADWITQNNNRTNNVKINGMTVKQYALEIGVNEQTLRSRIRKERIQNVQ